MTKVGFYKKEQGLFTSEVINQIKKEIRKQDLDLIDNLDFHNLQVINNQVSINGTDLSGLDLYFWHDSVDPSVWGSDNFYLNALSLLEGKIKFVNTPSSIKVVNDKFLSHTKLKEVGLPVAEYALVDLNEEKVIDAFEKLGGKVIIKPRFGAWGKGIEKVESKDEMIEFIIKAKENNLLQIFMEKYYENDLSKWSAVVVIGDEAPFGYRKTIRNTEGWMVADENRKDSYGQTSEYIDPSDELKELALKAKTAIGKDIIGFDFISTESGYIIVDENGRPGIYKQCVEGAGYDLVSGISNLILSKLR